LGTFEKNRSSKPDGSGKGKKKSFHHLSYQKGEKGGGRNPSGGIKTLFVGRKRDGEQRKGNVECAILKAVSVGQRKMPLQGGGFTR